MKCFYHNDRDAFGVDAVTGKGLCLECLEEYNGFIIDKNSRISKQGARHWTDVYTKFNKLNRVAGILFGILFAVMGLWYLINAGYLFFTENKFASWDILYGCFCLALVPICYYISSLGKEK